MKVTDKIQPQAKLEHDEIEEVNFAKEDFQNAFLEKSRFKMVFSSQQIEKIKKEEKNIKKVLKEYNLKMKVDYDDRSINIRTTGKTRDPYAIIDGKHLISLITRGVDLIHAKEIFDPNNTHLILNLQQFVKDKKVMVNRRDRLIGPKGDTLKALRMISDCFIQVEKKSVCVIGSYKSVILVEEFVKKCFTNYHPVHLLKQLIAKDECKNDKNKNDMDWSNFIPTVKKKVQKKK